MPPITESLIRQAAAAGGRNTRARHLWHGMIGFWPMIDRVSIAGDRCTDYSGFGNHGSFPNTPTFTPTDDAGAPPLTRAFVCDGGNDYMLVPASASLSSMVEATISMWVKWDAYGVATDGGGLWLVFKTSGDRVHLKSYTTASGVRTYNDISNIGVGDNTAVGLDLTNWHHVATTVTGTVWKTFFDGVQVDSHDFARNFGNMADGCIVEWGRKQLATARYFEGLIADCRLWRRFLSASEVRSIYEDPTAMVRARVLHVGSVPAAPAGVPWMWARQMGGQIIGGGM